MHAPSAQDLEMPPNHKPGNICADPKTIISWTGVPKVRNNTISKKGITKNTKVGATAAEDHEVEGSQATGRAHDTYKEVLQIHLECVAKAKVCSQKVHRQVRKAEMRGF